jgi:sugar lactone lactonase YvrE
MPVNATVKYSIKPNLPPGLKLNPTNGEISGDPTEVTEVAKDYEITVTGAGNFIGAITNTIKITTTIKNPITGSLVYSGASPYIFPIKTTITPLTSSGIMPVNATVAYSIKPNLPPGLNFNANNGTISGTPTEVTPETSYSIMAIGTGDYIGVITKIINIATKTPITGSLVYSGASPYIFPIKTTITNLTSSGIMPDNTTVAYSIKPNLPLGLNINATDGTISGTPTEAKTETSYTITATGTGNFTGVITKTIKITTKIPITGGLIYSDTSPYIFPIKTTITPLTSSGIMPVNTTVAYSIKPNLPLGLNINATDGTISGTPTELKPETSYTITVIGTGGFIGVITNIIKIKIDVSVTTLAGSGTKGSANGQGTAAQFFHPKGIAVDNNGNILVADSYNHKIRKITSGGYVTTLAGSGTKGFADGQGTVAKFREPSGIAVDNNGNIWVADSENHRIRKITSGGYVTTLAGSGAPGPTDGQGAAAKFNLPKGIAVDNNGNIWVADSSSQKIRKITSGGKVTTLAGSGSRSFADGQGAAAKFNLPEGIAVDNNGNILVADTENNKIRKITSGGYVTTLAGSGSRSFANGNGAAAKFSWPSGIAVDNNGNILVADSYNHKIRKITLQGEVTTLAGSSIGFADGKGTAARFKFPFRIVVDNNGNILVADTDNHKIRKIIIK